MDGFSTLLVRDSYDEDPDSTFGPPSAIDIAAIIIILVTITLCLILIPYCLRRQRRIRKQRLLATRHNYPDELRHTLSATLCSSQIESLVVRPENRNLIEYSSSPPPCLVPEIHITFPDEEHVGGKRKSGRVLVLRIGDSGSVGMGPISEEQLPSYQSTQAERFQSLDLERMGGLKEKEVPQREC